MRAIARVQLFSMDGFEAVDRLPGVEEGMVLMGDYAEESRRFYFSWQGETASLRPNVNCVILEVERTAWIVARRPSVLAAAESRDVFGSQADAWKFIEKHGGLLFCGSSWIKHSDNGEMLQMTTSKRLQHTEYKQIL